MSNTGIQITSIQNEDINIKLLAAQREIYTIAKKIFIWELIVAVPLSILVSIVSTSFPDLAQKLSLIFSIYTVTALVAEVIFEEIISNLKKKAASIQEQFDHNVLGIEWNNTLLPNKPELEEVYKFYSKYSKRSKLDNLYNWYSIEIREVETNLATLLCQRTNCTYDFAIRQKYTRAITFLSLMTLLALFIISASSGITISSFIIQVLAPAAPVFVLAFKQRVANKSSIENLLSLKTLLEEKIQHSALHSSVDNAIIRQIQDKIYYNRSQSPLLPDRVFNILRQKLEAGMHFSIQEQIRQLKINRGQ